MEKEKIFYPTEFEKDFEQENWLAHNRDEWNFLANAIFKLRNNLYLKFIFVLIYSFVLIYVIPHSFNYITEEFVDFRDWGWFFYILAVFSSFLFSYIWFLLATNWRSYYYTSVANFYIKEAILKKEVPLIWHITDFSLWWKATTPFGFTFLEILLLTLSNFISIVSLNSIFDWDILDNGEIFTSIFLILTLSWIFLYLKMDKKIMKQIYEDKIKKIKHYL